MINKEAREELSAWMATLAIPDHLRDNAAAMKLERDLIEEALDTGGARSSGNIGAVFHHLKTKRGIKFWPGSLEITNAIKELQRGDGSPISRSNDRTKLTFKELETLEEKVLPTARRWLKITGLRQIGLSTLEYWGEKE